MDLGCKTFVKMSIEKDEFEVENTVIKEEETEEEEDVLVIPGIKEEEEDFDPEEKVDWDGNYSCPFSEEEEIMAEEKFESSVEHFKSRYNTFKCQLFYHETGVDVICQVILLLYKDPQPLEEKLAILETEKSIRFNSDERPKIENFRNGTYVLFDLDFSLLFKIIQAVCGLKPIKDNIWTKHCPKNQREGLEHLLYKLKVGRNNFAHPGPEEKNISNEAFQEKLKEIKELLLSIVRKGGEKAGLQSRDALEKFVCDDLERICEEGVAAGSLKDEMKDDDLERICEEGIAAGSLKDEMKDDDLERICEKGITADSLKAEMEEYKLMMERKFEEHLCLYNKVREQFQRNSCIPYLNHKSINQVRVVNAFKKGFTKIKKKPNPPKQNAVKTKFNLPKRNASQNKPHPPKQNAIQKKQPPRQNIAQAKPNPPKQNATQNKQLPRQNIAQAKPNPPKQNATQNKQLPRQNTTQTKPNPPKQNATQNKQLPRQNTTQTKPNHPKQNATQNKQPPRQNTTQAKSNPPKQNAAQNKQPPNQNTTQAKPNPSKQNATQNKQPPRQNTTQTKPNPPKQNATQNKQPPRKTTTQAKPNPTKQKASQNKPHPPKQNT